MKTIILAAGRGKRMGKLTSRIPKPMLSLWQKPILEHIILGLKKTGIKEIIIVVGYKQEKIKKYFENGQKCGVRINYVNQKKQKGTGDALLIAEKHSSKIFLLHWGDILIPPILYRKIITAYKKEKVDVLLGLNWVKDPAIGGAVYLDKNNFLIRMEKGPKKCLSKTHLNQAGISILNRKIFKYIKRIKKSKKGEYDIESAYNLMCQKNLIKGFIFDKYLNKNWIDIRDKKEYRKLQKIPKPKFLN